MEEIDESELLRYERISSFEKKLSSQGYLRIAGVDEAGRGCLAGPVVAAACILPPDTVFPNLNDSKQLSADTRKRLFKQITTHPQSIFSIVEVEAEVIDEINILQATFLAMQKAVNKLSVSPDYLLIDGNRHPFFPIPVQAIIRGDALSISIAAASILAKVWRDDLLCKLDGLHPGYGWAQNKGYPTFEHIEALAILGVSPQHRKTFGPVKRKLQDNPLA